MISNVFRVLRWTAIATIIGLVACPPLEAQPRLEAAGLSERLVNPVMQTNGFYLESLTDDNALLLPTGLVVAPSGRMYVAEKTGRVRVVLPSGEVLPDPLVDLRGEVYPDGDRGLTGIALHPEFPATPYLYLFYSVDDGPEPRPVSRFRGYSRLVRYSVDATGEAVDLESRFVLLGKTVSDGPSSCYNSHSAGTLHFGHDGSLLASHGDGGSWAEPDPGGLYPECFDGTGADLAEDLGSYRALVTFSLAGKILRIDPETGEGLPDNPFWTGDGADNASRVWALGLRNPFRFALMPEVPETGPGALVIGDVGTGSYEELNVSYGGENFGWPCFEGPRIQADHKDITPPPGIGCSEFTGELTAAHAYFHHFLPDASAPAGFVAASITGGVFYTGDSYPERFKGMLFYADYASSWIAAGRIGPDGLEAGEFVIEESGPIVDLAYEPASDELVVVDIQRGRLARLRNSGNAPLPPVARGRISERYGELNHRVEFADDGSYDPAGGPLTYRWSFGTGSDKTDDSTASYLYFQTGRYIATLTVTNEAGLSSAATFPIAVGESMPELSVLSPTSPVIPASGLISVSLEASDRRDEDLKVFWEIDLVHNTHTHISFLRVDGAEGQVQTRPHAASGEVSFYRVRAIVEDEEGLRVEEERTLRDLVEAEIEVGTDSAGGGTIVLPRPLVIGRVALPLQSDEANPRVEVRENGEWTPVRYLHVLTEPDATQVLFSPVETDGVRVLDADLAGGLEIVAHVDPEADLPDRWDPVDAGSGAGRSVPFGDSGLMVVGAGSFLEGTGHLARQPFPVGSVLVGRLDAVTGGPDAAAGLTVRKGLSVEDPALTVGMTASGQVRAWKTPQPASLETQERDMAVIDLFEVDGPIWLRVVSASGADIRIEASQDSLEWVYAGLIPIQDGGWVAGPAAAGEGGAAVGWFGALRLAETTIVRPPEDGVFEVQNVFPNPGTDTGIFHIDAGRPGTYESVVIDALGRTVVRLASTTVEFPRTVGIDVERWRLAPGNYAVRVRHIESGDVRLRRFVTIR